VQVEIYDVDYNDFIRILGTAHFTRRSIQEAREAVRATGTRDLAIELDPGRFNHLNGACAMCPRQGTCMAKCEFIEACQALGNVNANIWLIDMAQDQMGRRIRQLITPAEASRGSLFPLNWIGDERMPWLWERGFKDEVIRQSQEGLEALRSAFPTVWRVLIQERNALMAARLAWIASKGLDEGRKPKILALVGAAHVTGIQELLRSPVGIRESLRKLRLPYTPPTLIRRISVVDNSTIA